MQQTTALATQLAEARRAAEEKSVELEAERVARMVDVSALRQQLEETKAALTGQLEETRAVVRQQLEDQEAAAKAEVTALHERCGSIWVNLGR